MTASTDINPIGAGAALTAGGPGATMAGATVLSGPATGVRAQTPEATPLDESSLCRQKRSPGAPRPASRTPIGTPTPERQTENEMSHANSWSLWDPFGSQEACRPNSAPLEQRQFSNMTPDQGKDGSPARSTANAASLQSPSVAANMPDLQTFHHPQPRRLQSVTPLLESEATTAASAKALLPLSPEHSAGAEKVTGLTLTAPPKRAEGPATHHEQQEDIARRGEPFTSTPSPEREGFGASNEEWAESPHPVMAHRSVQNTPEPTHYSQYNYGTGAIGLNGRLAEPISTPSPSVHSNVHHPGGNAHGPYLGVPPRFPDSHEASTVGVGSNASCPIGTASLSASLGGMPGGSLHGHQSHGHHGPGGVLMPPLSSGFSPSSAMLSAPGTTAPPGSHSTAPAPQSAASAPSAPPPTGTACAPARPGVVGPSPSASDALAAQLAANAASQAFTAYQMQMDNIDPALLAQVSAAKTPGQVASQIQAAMSQTSHQHLAQQGYQQAFQTGALRPPLGAAGWPMPNCPLPLGFPPAPHNCVGTSFPPVFGPQAGSPSGQSASNELRAPFLPTPAPVPVGTMPGATAGGQYVAGNAPAASPPAPPARSLGSAPANNHASPSQLASAHAKDTRLPASSTKSDTLSGGPQPAELNELRGQVVQLSKTQAGSKYLQRQLLKGNQQVVDLILHEVEQDVVHLMCDAYGNYLCSVAFQACSVRQRKRMLEKLAPRIAATACDKRGTHALQALITLLGTAEEQDLFMRAVKNHVIELCMDPNGTHVVQRLLFFFMPPFTDSIYIPVVDKMVEVAHHPYGLCVLKKCISQAKTPGTHQDLLLDQLAKHALDLVQSPYGNYAIQHALEEWGALRCMLVLKSLEGRMMQLSIQKFSSNVVEKIFCSAPPDMRKRFIDELIESDKMSALVNSNYGHYVVKRALQLAELVQVQALIDGVGVNLAQLPNRRLRAKWEKVLSVGYDRLKGIDVRDPELTSMMNGSNNLGLLHHDGATEYLAAPSTMPGISGGLSDASLLGAPCNALHAPGPGGAPGGAPGFIGHGLAGLGSAAGLGYAGMAGPLQGVASLPPQLQHQWAPWRSSPMQLPPTLREQ